MDKKYWFYLAPSVYVSIKETVLVYDTDRNTYIAIYDNSLFPIFESLLDLVNMGVVMIDSLIAQNTTIERIVKEGYGTLIPVIMKNEKPAMLPLGYGINIDFDRILSGSFLDLALSKDMSRYLLSISLILYMDNNGNCSRYFLGQSAACDKQHDGLFEEQMLSQILRQIEYFPISQVRLVVDDVCSLSKSANIENLFDMIHGLNKGIILVLNIKDFSYTNIRKDIQYEYVIDSYMEMEYLKSLINRLKCGGGSYRFVIQNESEYNSALELIRECELDDFSVLPFYNGDNGGFIIDLFSIEESDIFERPIPLKEIYRNTKINSNMFGAIVVAPNGDIFADVNAAAIGNVKTDKILDCMLKEVLSNRSWRGIRDFPRCQNCLFQYLCPPPSSYEKQLDIVTNCRAFKS